VTFPSARTSLAKPAILGFLLMLTISSSSQATIHYAVSLDHPEQHLFHVTMTIPDVTGEVLVQMAAWNALYQIRDFSNHLRQVEAFAGSDRASVEKLDKQTWRIKGTGTVKITYATYWDEAGPFASQLTSEHAFINPAMILLYVQSRRGENVSLSLAFPSSTWRAATALPSTDVEYGRNQSVLLSAASYDALV
jgi:predicted metalloprotease with PDZ domain